MGRKFVVEAIGFVRTDFGDSIEDFCNGSIRDEKDSRITPENGFTNIGYAQNPMDYIRQLEETGKKPKDNKL